MTNITHIQSSAENTQPITIESMMAAIKALGVLELKELTALKGGDIMLISGETAYYHPDMLKLSEVKVLRLPDPPKPELSFKWDFTTTENLKF